MSCTESENKFNIVLMPLAPEFQQDSLADFDGRVLSSDSSGHNGH